MKKCLFTTALGLLTVCAKAQDLQTVTTNGNTTTNRVVLGSADDGFSKLQVNGGVALSWGLSNTSNRPPITNGTSCEIRGKSTSYYLDDGFLRLTAGGGTNASTKSYIDLSGYSNVPDMQQNIVFGTSALERMRINAVGLVGIGVVSPTARLEVGGNAKINGPITSTVSDPGIGGMIVLENPAKKTLGTARSWKIMNMSGSYGNSLQFWAYDSLGCSGGLCASRFTLMDNGNVGIGTSTPQSLLAVAGTITGQRVKVTMTGWPDYVFDSSYVLPSLSAVERYIADNMHLPGIPSETEVVSNGLDVGDMQQRQMKKIEELTLYLVDQHKQLEKQQQLIQRQQQMLSELNNRVKELEKK
ncbi:hypothetical protein FHW36_11160 [Chitinophaga polysaccharea]|uniref:Endosialidase-like protein n=1 Tax=Chitinophaga polysaccharea TaxID=1293035 RepID=A0A561P6X5_9BACT|nr:hypothetical protein [Chitinophaga polysaccharea]TWF33870.1 hypothetical protein FHW36_11160 [Chitinophaga polysaccharea]